MSYIVDASVAVKWFVIEPHRDKARALLLAHGGDLEAPDFLLLELANIVWKKVRLGQIEQGNAFPILADTREFITRFHPGETLLDRALEIALALDHPVYDCLYLACAELSGRTLITDDRRLAGAVRGTTLEDRVETLADAVFAGPEGDLH